MEWVNQLSERAAQRLLMAAVLSHRDREGQRLADRFMKLPPRNEYPHYYEQITIPMDIETVSSKIETGLYADLNELQMDFLQMIDNARQFHGADSVISSDFILLQNLFLEEKTRIEHEQRASKVVSEVFSNKLLLDMIIDLAIHDEKKDRAISNRRSCRLVCKGWLQSTSRVLLKCQEPLFRFSFRPNHNDLAEFVSAVSGPFRLHNPVPPFYLEAIADKSFHDCLVSFGSGLVELCFLTGIKSSFTLDAEKKISLPNLGKFEVRKGDDCERRFNLYMNLVQAALDACERLKSFEISDFRGADSDFNICLPTNLRFPSTITELILEHSLPGNNLEALERILPPELKKIKLQVWQTPFKNGVMTKILEKVGKTLQRFTFWEADFDKMSTFRLPVMEKLNSFKINAKYLQLEQNFSSLETLAPVLKHITLTYHTSTGFRKWTERSCFHSVTSLKTSLSALATESNDESDNCRVNFDVRLMENMKRAFPNLRKLNITIYDGDTIALKFIMKEMTQLQELVVRADDSRYKVLLNLDWHPDFWSSLLLGIPIESVAALNNSPEAWENFREQSSVSIRNLEDLQKLHISCAYEESTCFNEYLSSAVFTHGFLCMPNLIELYFMGLDAPQESIEAWRKQNRVIKCPSCKD